MYQEIFVERLRQARKDKKLRQVDVADSLGIPRSTLAKYETGGYQPDVETLRKFINFYEIDANWLLGIK